MNPDKPQATPKDFFLWAGAMLAIYVSVFSFISLIFEYINYTYPEAYEYLDPYSGMMRFYIASLIVLVPLAVLLMRLIRRDIQRDPSRGEIWVRRWALYLTLFIAGATVVGDLITLINTFLGGEYSLRFILKVTVVLLVAGAAFLHFLADLRGYWQREPRRARMVGYATAALVLITIVAGFFIMGSPNQLRMQRYDDQKVSDLQSLQSQIVYFWQQKSRLPSSLDELSDPISGFRAPVDPQTGGQYEYAVEGPLAFRLCADFNAPSTEMVSRTEPAMPIFKGGTSESWKHEAGRTCFDRAIDPDLYQLPTEKPLR